MVEVMTVVFEKALFSQLEPHLLNCDSLDKHIYTLPKKIANLYLRIRIYNIAKEMNRKSCKDSVRSLLTRTIIFRNH